MGVLLPDTETDGEPLSDIADYAESVFLRACHADADVFGFNPLNTDTTILLNPVVAANLLFLGVVASMLCYIMWNTAVKELGPFRTANYIYIVPLVTLITSAIVIDEIITVVALIGSVFILSGVYIAERGFRFGKKQNCPQIEGQYKNYSYFSASTTFGSIVQMAFSHWVV